MTRPRDIDTILAVPDIPSDNLLEDALDIKAMTRQEKAHMARVAKTIIEQTPDVTITDINFNLYKYEEIKAEAVTTITNSDLSGRHSVNDMFMGVTEKGKECWTCNQDSATCPGHIGMIDLNEPILHPQYYSEIVYVLTSVCNSCSCLLVTEREIESKGYGDLTGLAKLRAVTNMAKGMMCRQHVDDPGVHNIKKCKPNPNFDLAKTNTTGKVSYNRQLHDKCTTINIMMVDRIIDILSVISDKDCQLMGFDGRGKPVDMIMRALVVIPPCGRPPVHQDGVVLPDDLTRMYQDIVRHNCELGKKDITESRREKSINNLIFHVDHMIDNTGGLYSQGRKKPYVSIQERIQGKGAIIRGCLMGKRVDFSARTVLGPDPSLRHGQIRIPRSFVRYLTVPVTVTEHNIGLMTVLMKKGMIVRITPKHGKFAKRTVRVNQMLIDRYILQLGDKVSRELMDGDPVVFNRQPSLHKYSVMAYETVLGDQLTIGLPLPCTTPHNADFDGDEGTIHGPQSHEVSAEMFGVMNVKNNIISTQNNAPIMAPVMDTIVGSFLLTKGNPKLDVDTYNDIVSVVIKDRKSVV